MDRKRRGEEKQRRLQFRREMRAKGLDPDMVDADGNPLPGREGGEAGAPLDAADEQGDEAGPDESGSDESGSEDAAPAAADAPPVADRSKP